MKQTRKRATPRAQRARKSAARKRTRRTSANVAVLPITMKAGETSGKAVIPVAVTDNPQSGSAAVTTAEIPVAVDTKGKNARRRGRKNVRVVPVALSTRRHAGRSRRRTARKSASRNRKQRASTPARHKHSYDPVVNLGLAATHVEESVVALAGQVGISLLDVVESIVRSALLVPPAVIEQADNRVKALPVVVPKLPRSPLQPLPLATAA